MQFALHFSNKFWKQTLSRLRMFWKLKKFKEMELCALSYAFLYDFFINAQFIFQLIAISQNRFLRISLPELCCQCLGVVLATWRAAFGEKWRRFNFGNSLEAWSIEQFLGFREIREIQRGTSRRSTAESEVVLRHNLEIESSMAVC